MGFGILAIHSDHYEFAVLLIYVRPYENEDVLSTLPKASSSKIAGR